MKRLWMVLVAGLLIAAFTAPALAWEFALTGEAEWRYRYFARQGDADLFGTGMLQGGVFIQPALGLAGPVNNQVLVQGFSAKGADAATLDQRFWFYPEIRVNPAVRMRGEYWVTGTNLFGMYDGGDSAVVPNGTPANNWFTNLGYNGWYFNSGVGGTTPSGMSVGLWEKFWVTAQSPWGILAFGRRPFAFGLGWSTLHEKDADTDSIVIVAPYGPITIIIGPSSAYGTPGDGIIVNSANIVGTTDIVNLQVVNPIRAAYGTDKNRNRAWHFASAFTYRNGPVDTGVFYTYLKADNDHFIELPFGPGFRDDAVRGALQAISFGAFGLGLRPLNGDIDFVLFVNYFKYNNGRFFFNAEYDFEYGSTIRNGGRPIDWRADAWWLELGALCGPSKLALAAMYSSGDDRRGGVFNVTAPTGTVGAAQVYDHWSRFLVFGGRTEAIKPYVWLMGIYGSGNNSFAGARGDCTYNDFFAYAGRLDYAVAANLNVWGSYIYAMRASNTATRIGQYNGAAPGVVFAGHAATPGAVPVPNVPDNYLGWEANVGVDWKLLENLVFKGQFAYWQPGDWFKWAYIDQSSIAPITVGGVAAFINPSRGIDPLIGFQGSLLVEF